MQGEIFNIQRYSIHDGPGIRTTVFLKGCPLDCWWCHNPESQSPRYEIMFYEDRCVACASCIDSCEKDALELVDGRVTFKNKEACDFCKQCSDNCFQEALELVGENILVEDIVNILEKDRIFYEESSGGITVSGGEPLLQADFSYEILRRCKEKYIHTSLDTSGYGSWEDLYRLSEVTDLFLYDLKLIDRERHRKYIGVDNGIILDNIRKLSSLGKDVYIRIPIIEGINTREEDIEDFIDFISSLERITSLNLIPYHDMGRVKYKRLGRDYRLLDLKPPSDSKMLDIKKRFEERGITTKIGG